MTQVMLHCHFQVSGQLECHTVCKSDRQRHVRTQKICAFLELDKGRGDPPVNCTTEPVVPMGDAVRASNEGGGTTIADTLSKSRGNGSVVGADTHTTST